MMSNEVELLTMNHFQILEDLLYLQRHAFEFTLEFNPRAASFQTPAEFDERTSCQWDWVNEEQRQQAYETGRFICASVYPNGSVTFYQIAGTSLEDIIVDLARSCREEQARYRSHGSEPLTPRTAPYPGPLPDQT